MAYNIFASNRILGLKFDIVTSTKIYLTSFASALATVLAINVLSFPYWILNLIARGLLFFGLYLTFIPISKTISSYDIENIQFLIKRYSFFKIVLAPVIKYERTLLNFVEKN
jgi:hypothetical protein